MPSIENIRSVFKVSPVAALILYPDSPHFTIAYANDAFLQIAGRQFDETQGLGFFDLFNQNNDELSIKRKKILKNSLVQTLILKKPHKEKLQRYDTPRPGSDGYDVRFWSADTYPILDQEGEVEFIVHCPRDVTDFVSNNTDFQHPLFNDYPDGVATIDLYGNFLNVNENFSNLVEVPKGALLKMSFVPFIAPEDFEMVFNIFQKAIHGEIKSFECNIIGSKGKHHIVNVTNLPILNDKEIIGIYLVAKDITEMVDARKQLDEYNLRISTILESITDGFMAVDKDWIITYFNKEAELMLHVDREKVIGKNIWQVFPRAINGKFFPEYHRAMSEHISVRFNEYVPSENMWVEVTAYPSGGGLVIYFKDTTQKILSEDALSNAKEMYQDLFDFSPLAIWVYDAETLAFLAVNETAIRDYGYSQEEFLSMSVKQLWPVADLPILDELLATRIKDRQKTKFRQRYIKKSGEIINVDVQGQPIPSWGENARIIIAADITDKMKAEEALKSSEQRFKALVQEGSDLIGILDEQGRYTYISPTYKRILGVSPEDLIGKNVLDSIYEKDRELVIKQFSEVKPHQAVKISPFRRLDASNNLHWIEAVVTDLSDEPAVAGIVFNSRDVTDRVLNEKKIRQSINHYNKISRASTDAIYDWDLQRNELTWSKGLTSAFGHQTLNENWFQLIHPDDADRVADALYNHLKKKKLKWKIEYRFRAADRNFRSVQDRGFFVYDGAGEPERMIGSVKDISAQVNYISSLEGGNIRLGEIAWMQSHILRAPLARIIGLSELLSYNEGEITQKELLEHLTASANELDAIIRNILQQSKDI